MARERYLLHAGEEEINRPGAEITLKTKKDKWNNFWFYHRVHVALVVVAVLFVAYLIYDMVTKVNPDYNVAILSSQYVSTDLTDMLSDELEKYGEDLNGDGQVVVQVNVFEILQGDAADSVDVNMQMAGVVKFQADLQMGESYLYLTDDVSFIAYGREEGVFAYLDGTPVPEGATDYENMRLPMSECKGLADTEIGQIFQDFSLSVREVRDDLLEDNPDYYLGAREMYENLVAGNVVNDTSSAESGAESAAASE